MSRPAIVFIGFMGAGKSTALAAAHKAGLETTEIDAAMEAAFGKPISQAFEEDGEDAFRAREAEVVGELLEQADGGAIALGGGSVLSERVRKALGRHVVVWLQVDAAEAWRRIEGTDRPLATSKADVERLLAERQPLYEELADAVVLAGSEASLEKALPAVQAYMGIPVEPARLLWATSESGDYPVLVGRGFLRETSWWPLQGRRFCISDSTVLGLYGDLLESITATVEVTPGEGAKTLSEVEHVLEELAALEMTREDHVVALGGGVVGDLAGFCAHIYQRGVPVVQVPTTLVAQVDSAYGGKTGVDLLSAKNYAGAYHLPAGVISDADCLRTLPQEELAAGFVEVLKTGLLAGGKLWDQVRSIEKLTVDALDEIIFSCVRYKCEVVAADERDAGLRAVLNLGHTMGHAIESASGYSQFRHGEAVGLGLLAALRLSNAPTLRDEVEDILRRHGLPVRLDPPTDTEMTLSSLEQDKKRTSKGVGFTLLSEPGKPEVGQVVNPDRVRAALIELYP